MARDIRVAIIGDSTSFDRTTRGVTGGATRMERALNGVRRAALGLSVAFAAREVVEFGGELITAAEDAQKVTRQTAAVIKSMGNAAHVSADGIADLTKELSLKAGVDDELIQSGANVLLTFRNIRNEVGRGNDIFDQATGITLDLSVALGRDMTASALLVGKALNDPIRGMTSLSRAGVQFTTEQREQVRVLMEAGDQLGAQKVIMAELTAEFSGSAEAQSTASAKLAVAWENVKEELGTQLLPVVERFTTWLAKNLPTAMAFTIEWGRRINAWAREHESVVKAAAVAVGVLLVGAMVAYTASAVAAAAATVAATWPVLLAVAAMAALAAGLYYAYTNWGWFREGVMKTVYALSIVKGWIDTVISGISRMRESINGILGPLNSLLDKMDQVGGGGIPGIPGSGLILNNQSAPGLRSSSDSGITNTMRTTSTETINVVLPGVGIIATAIRSNDRALA